MTTTTDLSWLEQFTGSADRPEWLRRPWRLDEWTGATNGTIAVLVRAPSEYPPGPADQLAFLAAPLDGHGHDIDLVAFRAWLTQGIPETAPPCEECSGTGKEECDTCDGEGDHECDCGHPHACGDCDGIGAVECDTCDGRLVAMPSAIGYAWLFDMPIDRCLIAPVLARVSGDRATVTVTGEHNPMFVTTADWRIALMPLSGMAVKGVEPRWPTETP